MCGSCGRSTNCLEGFVASGRELARRAGVTHPTALKALSLLVNIGLVTADRGLAGDAYDLNRNHLLAIHVASLFEAEAAIGVELGLLAGGTAYPYRQSGIGAAFRQRSLGRVDAPQTQHGCSRDLLIENERRQHWINAPAL